MTDATRRSDTDQLPSDPAGHLHGGHMPGDQPLEALTKDHNMVKSLFERYLNTDNMNVKQEAGPQILIMLEMHANLEEATFYPRVRDVDSAMIDQCLQEHDEARQLIEQLKGMNIGDPQCDQMFRQLFDSVQRHVEREEHQLFPKIQQSGMDLDALALEMQSYEASMVASQANASQTKRV